MIIRSYKTELPVFLMFHVVGNDYTSLALKDVVCSVFSHDDDHIKDIFIEGTLEHEGIELLVDEWAIYPFLLMWHQNVEKSVRFCFKAQDRLVNFMTTLWQKEDSDKSPLDFVVDREEDELTPFQQFKFYDISWHTVYEPHQSIHCKQLKRLTVAVDAFTQKMGIFDAEIMLVEQDDIITNIQLAFSVDGHYFYDLEALYGNAALTDEPTTLIVTLKAKDELIAKFNETWGRLQYESVMSIFMGLHPIASLLKGHGKRVFSPFLYLENYDLTGCLPDYNGISDIFEGSANSIYMECYTKHLIKVLLNQFEVTIPTENNTIKHCYIQFRLPYLYIIEELQPYGILTGIKLEEQKAGNAVIGFIDTIITMKASDNLLRFFNEQYPTFPHETPLTIFNRNSIFHSFKPYELVSYEFHSFD